MLTAHIRSARLECMNMRCDDEATHSVKAIVPINDCNCDKVEMFCSIRLCLKHANTIKIQELLPKHARDEFSDYLESQGGFSPDFKHAEIVPVLLNDIQMLMQERDHATLH